MLDQADILNAVREVQALVGPRGALVGGVALQRLGSRRFTADVDFIVAEIPEGLQLGPELSFGGRRALTSMGVPVDLICRTDDFEDLYAEALEYAHVAPDGVRVVSPEYLTAMKMVAGQGKDRADLEWLLEAKVVDTARARRIIKRLLGPYAAKEFDALVSFSEWRRTRE
jgi:hypothetical protein